MNGEEMNSPAVHRVIESDGHIPTPTIAPPDRLKSPRPPRWRRWLLGAIVLLSILGGIGWIVFSRIIMPMMMMSQMKPQATPVQIGAPSTSSVQDSSEYAATLDSRQSVKVQPRVSGQITRIYVEPGAFVEAGQPLVQIDAAQQQAQVRTREAAAQTAAAGITTAQADIDTANQTLQSLEAKLSSAQADLDWYRQEYQRFESLAEEGATSRQNRDERLRSLRTSEAAIQDIEAQMAAQQAVIQRAKSTQNERAQSLEQAKATVVESAEQLQDYTVTAPFSGTIGNIPAKEGDVVNPSTQLLTLTQNDQLEIQIQVPLDRSSVLRTGLPVKLLDDQNREVQTGRISFVAPDVDPATQSIQAKATFDNVKNFRTSQFIRTKVIWKQNPGVLVPTTAISRLAGRNFIFVATPFRDSGCKEGAPSQGGPPFPMTADQLVAAQRPIQLGKILGNDQEVLEGLKPSDRIITSGILQLQNCMAIADAAQMPKAP